MLGSLNRRLSLVLGAALGAAGVISVGAMLLTTAAYLEEVEQRLNHDLARKLIAERQLMVGDEVQSEHLKELFHSLMVINPRIEVYLLDRTGRILAHDAPRGAVRTERVDLAPVRRFLDGEAPVVRGDDPRHPRRRKIFSAAPLGGDAGNVAEGYLYVVLTGEHYTTVVERLTQSWVLRFGGILLLALLGTVALFAWLGFHLLTRRLRRLDRAIGAYGRGGREHPETVPPDRAPTEGDEVDRIEASFERLTTRIDAQVEALERAAVHRRELIASVSHDLRTPVASLQGYLETLRLKSETLPEEDRERYVGIALEHAQRLGNLVAELFELATLDAADEVLQPEPVSLAELVQDVAQKFELAARERGIALSTDLDPESPRIELDVRLMERVLENLIDNALRNSDEHDEVELAVRSVPGAVTVRVRDTGHGIAPQDLPRIFESFYRGNGSRSGAGGAGLGLAIAQRVVELHGSRLEVSSELGAGTAFWFRLSSAKGGAGLRRPAP